MYKTTLPRTMPNELCNLIDSWEKVSKSPYSNSFYNTNEKSWDFTPEGSFRISDHWNFKSDDNKIHCKTNVEVKSNTWTLAQYINGVYVVVKSYEFSKEENLHNKYIYRAFKFESLQKAYKLQLSYINGDIDSIKDMLNIKTKSLLNKVLKFAKKEGLLLKSKNRFQTIRIWNNEIDIINI